MIGFPLPSVEEEAPSHVAVAPAPTPQQPRSADAAGEQALDPMLFDSQSFFFSRGGTEYLVSGCPFPAAQLYH
jgi:hypothetical protein